MFYQILTSSKGYKRYQVNGRYYIDGGFTDNLPVIFPGETIRIQPFYTADPVEIMINEKYTLKSTIQGIVTHGFSSPGAVSSAYRARSPVTDRKHYFQVIQSGLKIFTTLAILMPNNSVHKLIFKYNNSSFKILLRFTRTNF